MLTVEQDGSRFTEINDRGGVLAVKFTVNGEYLVSGGLGGVQVWRAEDGKLIATLMEEGIVSCLAVSKDGRWIAAGTHFAWLVWDAKTYKQVRVQRDPYVIGVDFSPDSTRLVTISENRIATWDIGGPSNIPGLLWNENGAREVKYSPRGDRIAAATNLNTLRLYDSKHGRLLVDIPMTVTGSDNSGLLWSNDHFFVLSDGKIKQIAASTGLAVSEWEVPQTNSNQFKFSCITLSEDGKLIAFSANRAVTFWDTSTYSQLGFVQHPQNIRSIALSQDGRFLAIGGQDGKIIIRNLRDVLPPSCFAVSVIYCRL